MEANNDYETADSEETEDERPQEEDVPLNAGTTGTKTFNDFWRDYEEKKAREEAAAVKEEHEKLLDKMSNVYKGLGKKVILISTVVAVVAILGVFGSKCNSLWGPENSVFNLSSQAPSQPVYPWKKIKRNFRNSLKSMELEFPKQNRETWITLLASVASTMEEVEPPHPAAIAVLYPSTIKKDFPPCFTQKIARLINKAVSPIFNNITVEVRQIVPSRFTDPSTTISDFLSDIKHYFKHEGKAVITWNIDSIRSADHLLVFHGLCDSSHPTDNRATFLFPVEVPKSVFRKYTWIHGNGGILANDILNDAWKTTLPADSGPALVARVADSVILLNDGECTT